MGPAAGVIACFVLLSTLLWWVGAMEKSKKD